MTDLDAVAIDPGRLSAEHIHSCGNALHVALRSASPIAPLTDRYPDLCLEDAYAISRYALSLRLDEGECVVGHKVGVTSRVVQKMLNVHQPDFGTLTDQMMIEDGAVIDLTNMIAPRIEGEIAFILGRDLQGPGLTAHDVIVATESVVACFEIVDSRIADWKIRIGDTVADNASACAFVLGRDRVSPIGVDFATCGMVIEMNDMVVATGAGAAAMGTPVGCVAWLANTLGRRGVALRAGDVILSGALTPLIPVSPGNRLCVRIAGIGEARVSLA